MGIANSLQQGVEGAVLTFATSKSAALAGSLIPIAIAGTTIYLIFLGWALARGEINNSLSTIVWKVFKIVLISAIALGGGLYQSYVMNGINGIEGIFTTALGGTPTIGTLIDSSIVPLEKLTGELYKEANKGMFPNFYLLTAGVICTFAQVLVTACSLIPLLVAKVTLALMLAIGPAFILLALWAPTQRFTEAWLSTTLSAVFTVVIIAAVVGFLPAYMNHYATKVLNAGVSGTNILQDVISLLLVVLVLAWIAWKSADLAAQVIGGGSLGNPASAVTQHIMNKIANKQTRPAAANKNAISPAPVASPSAPLAHKNVISNLTTIN